MPVPRTLDHLNSISVHKAPSLLQTKLDPNADVPIYVGKAVMGAATSDDVWTIKKFTYSNGSITDIKVALTSWDLRTSATYS